MVFLRKKKISLAFEERNKKKDFNFNFFYKKVFLYLVLDSFNTNSFKNYYSRSNLNFTSTGSFILRKKSVKISKSKGLVLRSISNFFNFCTLAVAFDTNSFSFASGWFLEQSFLISTGTHALSLNNSLIRSHKFLSLPVMNQIFFQLFLRLNFFFILTFHCLKNYTRYWNNTK